MGSFFPRMWTLLTSSVGSVTAIILSMIMQCLYAIKAPVYRQSEFSRFEKLLSKWYLDLPDYLRHDPAASKNAAPLPHILTLHMQYWCTVLLLHRPL